MGVREARIEDAADIARIHVESWKTTYPGILPDEVLLRLKNSRLEIRWWESVLGQVNSKRQVMVAETGDAVVGFASGGKCRDKALDVDGEIYALYLLDHAQGMGLGRALFSSLSAQLRAAYGQRIGLWVVRDNPSRFFYEAMGGRRAVVKSEPVGGALVDQVGYRWVEADVSSPIRVR